MTPTPGFKVSEMVEIEEKFKIEIEETD